MARFSAIVRGIRATKPVEVPYGDGAIRCAVRPLSGAEEGEALAAARAYAVARGVAEPKATDRLYEIGVMAHTLAVACVDTEAPDAPYFDSADQLLAHLDPDRIAYLYELQQAWQDECAPRPTAMDRDGWFLKVVACAEAAEGEDPLASMRPVLRSIFVRTLAQRYIDSLGRNSTSTGTSATDTTS